MRHLLSLLILVACSEYRLEGEKPAERDSDPPATETAPPVETADTAPPDCSGYPAPEPYAVAQDETCAREPEHTVGSFDPVIEWQWTTNPFHPGYEHVMAAPAVGNLDDDDGDGRVTEADIPDVVFTAFTGSAYTSPGPLVAVSGDGTRTLWSVMEAGGHRFFSAGGVAIGDIDADGSPDVCAAGYEAAVVCVEGDGTLKWAAGIATDFAGCPAIADMDGDGLAEVVFGAQVFDAFGTLLGHGAHGTGFRSASVPVDWDGDGVLEVVAGNAVYELDGTVVWADGGADGLPAVADFDADGAPEQVRAASGQVILSDRDGSVLWSVALPGGGLGGAPTVADFDGDGAPEVGVAGLGAYTLFDTDGTILWSNATEDDSSSVTGSSVFDFEGDGVSEVVYADEHTLWIYSGPDGAILMAEAGHASGTLYEYPLVADVDADGSTEIVVVSNDYAWGGWQGVTVVGDRTGSWAAARPIWNQFAYHITNVEDDGSIPARPAENWRSWNNFRAGGTEEGPPTWQSDVGFGPAEACLYACDGGRVTLWLVVENAGLTGADDVQLQLVRDFGDVTETASEETLARVAAGEAVVVGPRVLDYPTWGPANLVAILDPGATLDECDTTDQRLDLGPWPCP